MKCIQSPILNHLDARNTAEAWIQKDWPQSIWNTLKFRKPFLTHTSNALKCVQTSSAMSTHVRCFWDGLKKPLQNHHEENQSVVPGCLRHGWSRETDSDAWSFDWSSTSPPVPSRMQLCKAALRFHRRLTPQHLLTFGPKSTAPWPLHHRNSCSASNWCQQWCDLTSRLWLRPDDEKHSEQSNFDASWKSVKFYALISECLDLKDSSKRSFPSTNQNRCKILEDHMMPKSRCPRIARKCWYYHYQ